MAVSDTDREAVASRLVEDVGAGRIDIGEFDRRVATAYAATTTKELNDLVDDLPTERKPEPAHLALRIYSPAAMWLRWFAVGVLCLVIWAVTSIASGTLTYPWPIWVIGPWGLALAAGTAIAGRWWFPACRTYR